VDILVPSIQKFSQLAAHVNYIGHDGKFRADEKILQEEKKIIEVEVKKKTVFAKRTYSLFQPLSYFPRFSAPSSKEPF